MSYAVIAIVLISLIHFMWEGIVAPSLRLCLRNDLFKFRDQLRWEKIEGRLTPEEFEMLHGGINFLLPRLNAVTISRFVDIQLAFKNDEGLRKAAAKRRTILENSKNPEFKNIHAGLMKCFNVALGINSAAWFIYIIPIGFVVLFLRKWASLMKDLVAIPASKAAQLFPIGQEEFPIERVLA